MIWRLENLNRQIVPPDLMGQVIESHAQLSSDERGDITEQILCVITTVDLVETAEDKRMLTLAIDSRVRALAKFVNNVKNLGFSIDCKDGSSMVRWELIQCAAQEPMLEGDDGYPEFDTQRLLDRYLKLVPVGGQA